MCPNKKQKEFQEQERQRRLEQERMALLIERERLEFERAAEERRRLLRQDNGLELVWAQFVCPVCHNRRPNCNCN